jgi:hypothetical protein
VSASALTLHVLAHRAGARNRDTEDWWGSAIETALAAVSASRHPPADREQAERALERVQRWRRTGQARPVSADAVALALAARTAATLAQADRELLSAAIEAVDAMAARGPAVVPELHLALAAWALDDLVVDRDEAPWPGLRTRLDRGTVYGVDAALRNYAAAVAARRLDPRALVQDLIARVPASPTVADGSVVLWLLGVAVDRVTRSMPSDEPGLSALVERCAALTERLAVELDEDAFRTPHVDEFDPQGDRPSDPTPIYLSPMEALLLDIALAPADPEQAWLTFSQARALFGGQAAEEQVRTARERRRRAFALGVAAVLAGAVLALALALAGANVTVAVGWGAAVGFAGLAFAIAVAHPVAAQRRLTAAAGVATVTASLCAGLNAVNQMLDDPLLPDAAGMIAGAVLTAIAAVVWAAIDERRPSRSSDDIADRRPSVEPRDRRSH